uniref:Nucleolar protein 10 n=1 Tax=Angiostrongylus cantonensis TaxID=6313 RepID=A0A0K0DDF2_ANGCA
MQVSSINDVRIYNLSSGKSIPEVDVRRRVQLIQDFEMPDVSHTVNVSQDGRYVFVTGCYKSWLKCYDLENLSLKFQRGLDAAVVKLISLGDDYSKIILLEEDRFLEMHAAFGRYFRMRMPRFGRDMAYSFERSDLHLVGASSEVYRLNLELGEWLSPLQTNGSALNCCKFAQPHQLFVCGTTDGQVEAWDHRDRSRVGILDCFVNKLLFSGKVEITSLNFRNALCLGVGTSSGHVMLYDIRSRKPLMVKDHINGLPIKRIDFDLVLSMDSRVLKIWNAVEGKPFAAIETDCALNDFCRYFDSGLIFFANEGCRLQQFFIPALGTAPKWCYYLETITEELEENQSATLYDDYKFVTKEELDKLGISNLIGTSVLRAYMHGYFLDRRLYEKAQLVSQPDAYEKYVDRKVGFRYVCARLNISITILEDGRFKKLFENQDFEVANIVTSSFNIRCNIAFCVQFDLPILFRIRET